MASPSQFPGDPFFPLINADWLRTTSVVALSGLQAVSLFAVESTMPDSNLNTRIVAFILAPVVIFLASYPAARDLVRRLRTPEPLLIDT